MIIDDVIKYIEKWAPPGAAWENDNIGVQVGSRQNQVKNILICLELTAKVLQEAKQKKCNLIITHHPFIFKPLKNLDYSQNSSKLLAELIKNDITLYAAHTNLDFTKDGVSYTLAEKIGLSGINFLEFEKRTQYKIVVFVPENDKNKVSEAIFKAGGGIIGNYDNCSFRSSGIGSFKGNEASNPNIGKKNNLEFVDEIRVEFIAEKWNLNKILKAMIDLHPYETPAYDIYSIENENLNYGFGAIGELNEAMNKNEFLAHIKRCLSIPGFRYCEGKSQKIKKVAVCGGSGSDLFATAIKNKADAFITADIKYHTFMDAEDKIMLIDAGHYETEIMITDKLKHRLTDLIKESVSDVKVFKYSKSTNPVKFLITKEK